MEQNQRFPRFRLVIIEMSDKVSEIILPEWKWSRLVLYVASITNDIFGWLAVLLAYWWWGEKGTLRWEAGVLRAKLKKDSWLDKRASWAGVCITAHAMLYRKVPLWPEELDAPYPTQIHEHVHVEQGEGANLLSLVQALILLPICAMLMGWWSLLVFFAWWALMGHLGRGLANKLTAVCRGEDHYWGSTHEEAARALARTRR